MRARMKRAIDPEIYDIWNNIKKGNIINRTNAFRSSLGTVVIGA